MLFRSAHRTGRESGTLSKPNILQILLRQGAQRQEAGDLDSSHPEWRAQAFYRAGRTNVRAGAMAEAIRKFDQAIALLPDYAEAIAARAEALDVSGKCETAAPEYERARQLWSEHRSGAPDRSYLYRQHGRFTFEIDSYQLALQRIKTGAYPHLASGNALLIQGRAKEALQCYERALKIKRDDPSLVALKGEALSMLGKYDAAIDAFDFALAAIPESPEILNARAIARAAKGEMLAANADWRRQLELLPTTQSAARAYVSMRLAHHEAALPELERAFVKAPTDLYWQLYRLSVLRRLGRPAGQVAPATQDTWPAPQIGRAHV